MSTAVSPCKEILLEKGMHLHTHILTSSLLRLHCCLKAFAFWHPICQPRTAAFFTH